MDLKAYFASVPPEPTVVLLAAPLTDWKQPIADHLYFVETDGSSAWTRWEVWQDQNAIGKVVSDIANVEQKSVGHLYQNLKLPWEDVTGGPSYIVAQWKDAAAVTLRETLRKAPDHYRFNHFYRKWPGPNSNSFATAMLEQSHLCQQLPTLAIGKNWYGFYHLSICSQCHFLKLQTFLGGVTIFRSGHFEMNFLGFACSIDIKHRRIEPPWRLRLPRE